MTLGTSAKSDRGFSFVEFKDDYDKCCTLQCSSVIGDYEDSFDRPGTSAVWLGVDDAEPRIMAKDAAAVGIRTSQTTGWIPYPIPDTVLLSTRMHLNREQVAGLITRLQEWLNTGKFE